MGFQPDYKSWLAGLAGGTVSRYIRLVHRTSTVVLEPPDARQRLHQHHPYILAMWHGQFGMMPALHIGEYKVSAIAARHGDAEVLAKALNQFNIDIVRGAGANGRFRDRGGVHALRTAIRLLKGGSTFAMTADVPPGPARYAGDGIVTLARLSGRPILPLAVASSRFITFNSWSRMTVNLPYSTLVYVTGEPIWIPADIDGPEHARYRQQVEDALNVVTERAYKLTGADIKRIAPPVYTARKRSKSRA